MLNLQLWLVWIFAVSLAARAADFTTTVPKDARVVIANDPSATESFNPIEDKVAVLFERGLTNLALTATAEAAWSKLISTQDTVGIKVYSSLGGSTGTRPAVVRAVVQSLLQAGIAPNRIIIWDKRLLELRLAGFVALAEKMGVRVAGAAEDGYDDSNFYENELLGKLVWGDHEFGKKGEGVGRKSYVSKLVTQKMTKIISVAPLLNHNLTGVCGELLSVALGSVDNTLRFELDPTRLARAIPEIYALPSLGDRVILNVVDALLCQYLGEERGLLHYSAALNELRFSHDPVALDILSIQELERQRERARVVPLKPNMEIYQNAALLELGINDPRHILIDRLR
jgi:hypothetical protein